MHRHTITLEDFNNWKEEKIVTYAESCGVVNKSIGCNLYGGIIVTHDGKEVYKGMQPFAAVEIFNEIQP